MKILKYIKNFLLNNKRTFKLGIRTPSLSLKLCIRFHIKRKWHSHKKKRCRRKKRAINFEFFIKFKK